MKTVHKPFIKLFRTPNCNYFLDVNKNKFIQISEPSFQYLRRLLGNSDGSNIPEPMPQEIAELQAGGYLSCESVVQEVRHHYTDYLDLFLDRKLSKITLQLTQDCNFRCKYCVYTEHEHSRQRNHSTQKMSWETAKKAVDFLWEHSVDSKSVNVGFYGGEPLLEFPLLKRIHAYCLERFEGKTLTFSITTNGTLLSDEIILFFKEHDISIMISLDGPREVNDQNRVFANGQGTYDAVIRRINRIKEIAPDLAAKMNISMVINPENDFDCINQICLDGAELEKININPTLVSFAYEDREAVFSEEYSWKNEYQKFLAILSYVNRFSADHISPIAKGSVFSIFDKRSWIESVSGLQSTDAPSGPCIPGQMRLFINASGQFFPCERVSEKSPCMQLGTLDDGFNYASASHMLNVGHLTEDACKQCWCFRYCNLCVQQADDGSDTLSAKAKLSCCEKARAGAYSQLRYYLLMKEISRYYQQQLRVIPAKEGAV